jgi:hypothetical protein
MLTLTLTLAYFAIGATLLTHVALNILSDK